MTFKAVIYALLASTALLAAAVSIQAIENKGADQIRIDGGTRGDVAFPHRVHQNELADCSICHTTFPQQKGAIESLKQEGKLARKQVMNKLCTKCHREKKAAGEKTGPTTCNECHQKK